jgi:hypothetical protein
MKQLSIACCILFLTAQVTHAQTIPTKIYQRDQVFGRGRITTFEKLTPVNNAGKPDAALAEVTLRASDWTCGRCFSDERGRRWCLVDGAPIVEKPALLKGLLLQGESGQSFFLHDSGSLYLRTSELPAPRPEPRED